MAGKVRYRGPGGAIFVPNVPADTIAKQVADGIWTLVEEPVAAPKKASKPTK